MIRLSSKYSNLFKSDSRYYVITGGRGSSKSSSVAAWVCLLSFEHGHKILFTRQTMTSAHISIIQEFKPSLIMCREMIPMQACSKASKGNIPILLDMAEHYPAAMREWKKYNQHVFSRLAVHQLRIPDKIEAHAVRNAQAIITVCKEQNERLHAEYNVRHDAMFIVHNTPDEHSISGIRKGSSAVS